MYTATRACTLPCLSTGRLTAPCSLRFRYHTPRCVTGTPGTCQHAHIQTFLVQQILEVIEYLSRIAMRGQKESRISCTRPIQCVYNEIQLNSFTHKLTHMPPPGISAAAIPCTRGSWSPCFTHTRRHATSQCLTSPQVPALQACHPNPVCVPTRTCGPHTSTTQHHTAVSPILRSECCRHVVPIIRCSTQRWVLSVAPGAQ